jgi:hypothetical protein
VTTADVCDWRVGAAAVEAPVELAAEAVDDVAIGATAGGNVGPLDPVEGGP